MYSIEEIKENYENFSDSKIENIAKNESKGLRKEVRSILKDEIHKRNLDKTLVTWVEVETDRFEGMERESLIHKIQNLNCPRCDEKKERLYGFEIHRVVSPLLFTFDTRKEKVLCRSCGRKEKLYAILITFFAGWRSRRGILLTPFTVLKDTINFMYLNKISDRIVNRIVDENTGSIRYMGTDDKVLTQIVDLRNKQNISADDGYTIPTP